MQSAAAGAFFPAFFSDGERETHIGTILVHPSLRVHDLKLTIAQQIGVSPDQFTVFLADRGDPRSWPGKVAVTAKFDFAAAAARQEGARCSFLVVLKRSRRERRKAGRYEPAKSPPGSAMLLRRDRSAEYPNQSHIPNPPVHGLSPAMVDQYRELQAERERYLAMTAALEQLRLRRTASHVACEKCEEEEKSGSPSAFHCCQNDPVVVGFRTRAGTVARPVRRPGEGATGMVGSSE
ncbi:uncharacterized protein J3R85_019278 [Psidium guajava]|nr:uncharacterized protein J3R85_019278 [Psidium guajava]